MMLAKPTGLSLEYAQQFQDESVVAAYIHRQLYPDETFVILERLIRDSPRTVLDVGCGTGNLARFLAARVERVDAVDFSPTMIAHGKRLPNGNASNLNWILNSMEEAELAPPYALITAGMSLHWVSD